MEDLKLLYPNENIKLIGEGWCSSAFEVGEHIIRIPRVQETVDSYKNEEKILKFLQGKIKSVEIPSTKFNEKPFFYSIHKKLNGENWSLEDYEKLSEKEKDEFANDAAIFFMELHSIELDNTLNIKKELEILEIDKYLSNEFTFNEITKLNNYINVVYTLKEQCLVHNDFYFGNSLMNKERRLKCVFDFGNARYCNYHFEFRDLYSPEDGEADMFKRIIKYYNKKVDIELVKILNIYDALNICIYLSRNPKIKEEKIDRWNTMIKYIKECRL